MRSVSPFGGCFFCFGEKGQSVRCMRGCEGRGRYVRGGERFLGG